MKSHLIEKYIRANIFVAIVYSLFSGISLIGVSDTLLITPRHEFVFEHLMGRVPFGVIDIAVAVFLAVSLGFPKMRLPALLLVATNNLFWAGVAIVPALIDPSIGGNTLSTVNGVALAMFSATTAAFCYYSEKDTE